MADTTYNFPFSQKNWDRAMSPKGFNCEQQSYNELALYLLVSLGEEVGELMGAFKKLLRGFNQREFIKLQKKVLKDADNAEDYEKYKAYAWENVGQREELNKYWLRLKLADLGSEAADVLGFFDLFLTHMGIDLETEFTTKFNKVSKEMGCQDDFTL